MIGSLTWIDLVWSMAAGACLTLAGLHLGSWLRQRERRADFHFAVAAMGVFFVALVELTEMRATTAEQFIAAHYWIQGGLLLAGLGLAGFVPAFFGSARPWLLWTTVALRCICAVVNFSLPHGINYAAVPAIERLELFGALATVAIGVHTHWTHLDEIAWTFSIVLTLDSALAAWRRSVPEERARILRVGGAILFVYAIGVPLSGLIHAGFVRSPYFVTPIFVAMLGAMGAELARDMVRATSLRQELHASETRLRASERDFELAAEAAGLGIGTLDLASGELTASARVRQQYGFGESDPMPLEALLARTHPDDRERTQRGIERAVATQEPYEEEYRVLRPGGGWVWLAARARVTEDEDGPGLRLRGVTFEVTARRNAEERFRLIFDAAQSALLIVDGEGRIALANARAEAWFGWTREELRGMPVESLLPAHLRARHAGHRATYFADSQARAMGLGRDLVALRRNGTEFPVEIGLSPLPGPDGPAVLASIVDITERREIELAAARQRSELAHLSRVAVLGELSASLAHELNQPLAAILSNAQAAQRFLDRESLDVVQLREIVSDIVEDDKRAGEVIRRLRAMLRKEELVHLPLDLNEVVRDVLQIMNSDFINRGVQVATPLAANLPPVAGDRVQLQQVLLNLLINGCDAMAGRPKPRRLTVRTAEVAEGVELTVSDSGTGIPSGELERIFEPFVTTKEQGTGLGLAVCRTIVAAHGGTISAHNVSPTGACFRITLKAASALG